MIQAKLRGETIRVGHTRRAGFPHGHRFDYRQRWIDLIYKNMPKLQKLLMHIYIADLQFFLKTGN